MSGFWPIFGFIVAVTAASLTSLSVWSDGRHDADLLRRQLLESAIVPEAGVVAARILTLLLIIATLLYMHADKVGRSISVHNLDLSVIEIRMVGLRRFFTFTVWSWCLQGVFFALTLAMHAGLVPATPALVRAAVVMFEVSLSMALLVSTVVSFVLIPAVVRAGTDVSGFFTLPAMMMHNANVFFMIGELIVSQVEVKLAHLPFSVLFGIAYILFSWAVAHRIGFFFYFFLNYNFKHAFVSHLMLMGTLGGFYALAALVSHYFNPEQNAFSLPILLLSSMLLCTVRMPRGGLKST